MRRHDHISVLIDFFCFGTGINPLAKLLAHDVSFGCRCHQDAGDLHRKALEVSHVKFDVSGQALDIALDRK
jgi:hypothetical protein